MVTVLAPSPENVARAAQVLRASGVVGMPTETVYGLAAIVFDEAALARVFAVKDRPTFDPLIVHVALGPGSALDALDRAGLVDPTALGPLARARVEALAAAFWPGPLTLVLPKRSRVPDLATAGLGAVGVRAPAHPVARALIEAAGAPLAAPSANRFGRISPTTATAVVTELGERISLVLDGGPCAVGVESTVVRVAPSGELELLRPGGVPLESLETATGARALVRASGSSAGPQASPGALESHYAPRRPLTLLPGLVSELAKTQVASLGLSGLGVGLLAWSDAAAGERLAALGDCRVETLVLSPSGLLEEAARHLFSSLRALDERPVAAILAEPPPTSAGLGHAILDRLRRASAPRT